MPHKTVDDLLEEARSLLQPRPSPVEAALAMARGAKLVDIRSLEQKFRGGVIPGVIEIGRNEFEWRCDPSSPWRDPRIAANDYSQRLIVICNEGYQSSMAAANLRYFGMTNVTDVDGGFVAWVAAALPITSWIRSRLKRS